MISFLFICLLWSSGSLATETYLVTATKIYTPTDQAVSSVQIYGQEEIEKYGSVSVPDFLQNQTGLYFNSQGAYGGTQILKQRGLTGFTKIILDDVELEDPSSIGGSFQLQMLSLDQIESIEVINGPHSALYGTDSVAGVIKINTKKGNDGSIVLGGGSHASIFASGYFSQKFKKLTYRFATNYKTTEGISSFNANRKSKAERDSFNIIQLNPSIEYQFTTRSKLYFSLHAVTSDSEIDSFSNDQSANDRSDFDNGRFTIKYQNRIHQDRWEYKLTYSQSDVKRIIDIPSHSEFRSQNKKVDFINTLFWNRSFNSLFGLDYEYREASTESSFDNFSNISVESTSFYTTHIYNSPAFTSETSYRYQSHESYGNVNTYKQSFLLPVLQNLKIKTSYGHSFRSPTLYELKSTNFGNPDLNPTRVHSFEVGLETKTEQFFNSLTYFHNSLKDSVDFAVSKYFNINRIQTQGVEIVQRYKLDDSSVQATYTYTDVENETSQARASKIPKDKITLSLQRKFSSRFQAEVSTLYIGRRYDSSGPSEMPSYALMNASFKYTKDKWDYSFYIHNLLNKDYEDSLNYGTRGLSIYAWLKTSF